MHIYCEERNLFHSPYQFLKVSFSVGEHGYILRPEVIEGWFYLWRLTGKPIYKEWVWAAIQAIEKYCKKEGGYAGLVNVYDASGVSACVASLNIALF